MPVEAVAHYRQFLDTYQWLEAGGFGWTVYKTDGAVPGVGEIADALSVSGDVDIQEMAVAEEPLSVPESVVFFEMFTDGYFLFQPEESYISENVVLENLSVNGRLWNISWSAGYHSRLACAEAGEINLKWLNFQSSEFPRPRAIHAVEEQIDVISRALRKEDQGFTLEEMMAVMELATGVRLPGDWVDGVHPCMIINDPLPQTGWPFD